MFGLTRYQYKYSYIIDLDACQKYFTVGLQRSYDDIKPCVEHGYPKGKKLSAEERRLYGEESLQFKLCEEFMSSFRDLRRDAPPEARVRLVLPHCEHPRISLHVYLTFSRRLHSRSQHECAGTSTRTRSSENDSTTASPHRPWDRHRAPQGRPDRRRPPTPPDLH